MKNWCNYILVVAVLSLLFIAIPISYTGPKSKEQMKPLFDEYIQKYNKSYKNKPEEYERRFKHFMASMEEIDRLNSESRGPEHYRARYGLTKLSDMSSSEYREIHLSDEKYSKAPRTYNKSWDGNDKDRYTVHEHHINRNSKGSSHESLGKVYMRRKRAVLPMKVDWRDKGVVGPIKNQGLCGACWAFSTVGTIESMYTINTGKVKQLSVQEAIDCAGLGNQGCAGGDICLLLDWLLLTKMALELDNEYPTRLADGLCRAKRNATGVTVTSFTCDDFVGSEQKIIEMLALHGPVSVAVNAITWQNYLGGVVQYHCSGAVSDLNHAVQLVGYDLTADVPYFIARNSWGEDFGIRGYIHLAVGNNICGLANEVASIEVA